MHKQVESSAEDFNFKDKQLIRAQEQFPRWLEKAKSRKENVLVERKDRNNDLPVTGNNMIKKGLAFTRYRYDTFN